MRRPYVIARRGASATRPDDALASFAAAMGAGADGIELVVRRSADDVLVLHHDAHLPDGRRVRDVLAAELPAPVPTLAEALMLSGSFVGIEIKNSPSDPDYDAEMGISLAVAGLVASLEAHQRTLVSAFEMETLSRLQEVDPDIALGWLTWGQAEPRALIARAGDHGLQGIIPHDRQVDGAFVERARAAGLQVYVWTVDDVSRALELAEFGVDGIVTNEPGALSAAFREREPPA
jgi:glycerophosphoryl diester phosphodiesterase